MVRWHASLVVLACVHAGCYSGGAPTPSSQQPPPTLPTTTAPSDSTVASGDFAKPPPGAQRATPPAGDAGASTALPTTGPECPLEDCPTTAPLYPTEQCSDGVHTGGRGPCVRFSTGRCNWSGLVCPAPAAQRTCRAADCDLPVPAEWMCPDGKSIGRFTCVPTQQGMCGATYRPCPRSAPVTATRPPPAPQPRRSCGTLPSDRELATWKIESVCGPGQGPAPPPQKVIRELGDGTRIIEMLGRCMRVRYRRCLTKCLPPQSRIATPSGDVPVRDIRVGAEIWTRDAEGRRVVGRVEKVASIAITGEHHVARVVLGDGRSFIASPEHPVLGDRVVQDLRVGESYDGSTIAALDFVRYTEARTYDLLPSGATGVYWADDAPLRSTLGLAR